ncbi:PKD-like family lipoprotein [Sphingobacterium bovistauri]|uniref:PKD-like family protein n=1 Tax=Sphingobacterium bovistauri TaxID=2781959 RepID=A0ABS7Z9I8_9SPHI|nr:PKD-like family lipoprotein [Sphingobacterium bovistauri]MCA5006242.1 hypothetical protein [Sphingobacterium bovistauri]
MKIIINVWSKIGILLFIILQISCYKDKGSYDISEINKVSVLKNGSDTIKINQFDTLKVQTLVEQSLEPNSENLAYKWSVYLSNPPITGLIDEVLSESKDLNVQFWLRPDSYTLLYTVTDQKTGVSTFKKYLLQVGSKLSEGWLLISENASGESDIDLLHPDGYSIKNLLSTANPNLTIPRKLHTARVLTTMFGGSQDIFLLGESESVRVKYTDFTKINMGSDWFVEKPREIKPEEFNYNMLGANTFYIDNGKIYSNQIDFRFGVPVSGEYKLSKYFISAQSSDAGIFYDEMAKKFVNYGNKQFRQFSVVANAPFEMGNVGLDVMFGGVAPLSQYSFLMKDEQQVPYVLRIHSAGLAVSKHKVDNASKLFQASAAAFSGLYFHIYYGVGNELYLLDVANNTSKLVYTFPTNINVTSMRMKQTRSSFVGFPDNNRTLAVGTYDGQEGRVYVFSINNIGEFVESTYTRLYEGLNKPISLEYKNKK